MIFCTIGTTRFPFDRMVYALDKALTGHNEKLVLQTGEKNYAIAHQSTTLYREMTYKQMVDHLSRARAVVCHGGAGTLLLALRHAAIKPFVLPRLARLKEHVDDHQLYFSTYMKSRGLVVLPSGEDDISTDLRSYLHRPPRQNHTTVDSHKNQLEGRLAAFLGG